MKNTTLLIRIVITTLILSVSCIGYAQEDEIPNDPMNNSEVWTKITERPNDRSLWVQYFQKPWLSLSTVDKENIKNWRLLLNRNIYKKQLRGSDNLAQQDDFWNDAMTSTDISDEMKVQIETERAQLRKAISNHVLNESDFIESLKQNISANFIILEDILKAEFAELGHSYEMYDDVHPSGDISKEEWLQRKSNQLKRLKESFVQEVGNDKPR